MSEKSRKTLVKITGFGILYGVISLSYTLIVAKRISFDAIILTIFMSILFIKYRTSKNQ
ncbi:hypothetical protein [Priestia filamentosa]|uniref:hypothetical protein n=1 Tax=Priestia filamentosa TaxID=1402861 RepID=UPI0039829647